MEGLQHGFAQDGIDPCLIALALALEPQQYIRIDANRCRLLGRLVERVFDGMLPELVRQRRNVAVVDLAVGQGRQRLQLGLLCGRQGRQVCQINFVVHGLAHSVSFPWIQPCGQK